MLSARSARERNEIRKKTVLIDEGDLLPAVDRDQGLEVGIARRGEAMLEDHNNGVPVPLAMLGDKNVIVIECVFYPRDLYHIKS
jgi:hypothetical protein